VNLQDEIKKAKELLSQLENKHAVELAKPKSKRALNSLEIGTKVSYLGGNGNVHSSHGGALQFRRNDNSFVDYKAAELQAQRNTLVYRMRLAALDCPVDWSNEEAKYLPIWDYVDGDTYVSSRLYSRSSQLPHFACDAELRKFIRLLSKDEQKLLICGVE
jgi:hypothetical protein